MELKKIPTRKALNPAYRKEKPNRSKVNAFRGELKKCLVAIKAAEAAAESEEFIKQPIKEFLQNTFYNQHLINTKGRIDLAIYTRNDVTSDVGVIIEVKRPSNKPEFLSEDNINKKALQELLLYYLRERIDCDNNNIKQIIATNGYEWYLFKAEDFYKYFYKNKDLLKDYNAFKDGKKDSTTTELFYSEIAKKYIAQVETELPFVYLNFTKHSLDDYSDNALNTLYKVFSDVNILGKSYGNDSNELNKTFYKELLHIIGLEEFKDKGKKVIYRKNEAERDYASLLENAIFTLEDKDHLSKVTRFNEDKAFNAGLALCLTWVNRILFLKLLESQLLTYHNGAKDYKFLNSEFITGFDDLNDLFFSALAKDIPDRHPKFKDKFKYIPYLNSSLFERNDLETSTFAISALNDEEIEVYKSTILKENNGKRFKGKLSTLDYLFKFLDAFDFATDGKEGITDDEETKTLINASVLGMIFEKINGYKEGSFYTPAYITMYMCKDTLRNAVVQKFKDNENDQIDTFENLTAYCHNFWKQDDRVRLNIVFNSLKICDPAVGSGHFLVSALNELIVIKQELGLLIDIRGNSLAKYDMHIENDELYVVNEEGHLIDYKPNNKESARVQHTLFHEKQTLIENCLFGVDINPNSVKICRLRLWIELLKNAYYTSEGVLQTLPNIDINIKCGNSLISRFDLKDDLQEAFQGNDVKYNFKEYREAVKQYKASNSKEQKREVLEIINEVKHNFKSSLDKKFTNKLTRLELELNIENERINNITVFGEKINKGERDRLKVLKNGVKNALSEKKEIVNNSIFHNAFEWRFEFPEVLDETGNYIGFDVVIGNPPYLQLSQSQELLEKEKKYILNRYKTSGGRLNTFIFFTHLGSDLIKDYGNLNFIIPNTILSQEYYSYTRDFLINKVQLNEIVKFPILPFEDAVVETVILQYTKKITIDYEIPLKTLTKDTITTNTYIKTETINKDSKFSFIYVLDPIIEKVYENEHVAFGDICNINQGIALKGNKSLSLKDTQVNGKYYKLLDGRNINKYTIDWAGVYLDYDLERIHSCKRKDIFQSNEKLLFRRVSSSLIFTYDDSQYFGLNTLVVVNMKDCENAPSIKFILGLMNSKLFNYIYSRKFKSTKTVFSEIQARSVKELPIPKVSVSFENTLIEKVEHIISINKATPGTNTYALEQEIDHLVYKLYDLNKEEVMIVEGLSK